MNKTPPKKKNIKLFCGVFVLAIFLISFLSFSAHANAATKTWTGGGATPWNWSDLNNWGGVSAPVAGDDLVFPAGPTNLTTNNDYTAGTVFNSITLSGGGYTLAGNSVSITSSTTDNNSSATGTAISLVLVGAMSFTKSGTGTTTLSGANTFSGGVTLNAGGLNINNSGTNSSNSAIGTGPFTINGGTIDNTSSGNVTLATNNSQNWNGDFTYAGGGGTKSLNLGTGAITPNASRTITVNAFILYVGGAIGDINGGGAFSLTKAGTGYLYLSGASTYTGTTTNLNGFMGIGANVSVNSPGPLGSSNTTVLLGDTSGSNGARLYIYAGGGNFGRNITLQSGNSGGIYINNNFASPAVFSGNIIANHDFSIYTQYAGGTLTFSGVISGTHNLTVNTANDSIMFSGNNSFTGSLMIMGTATFKLGAAGDGTNGPLGTIAGVTYFQTGGPVFDLNGYSLSTAEPLTIYGTGISSGGALINSSSTAATYSGLITLGSASSIVGGTGTINISNAGTITGSGFGLTLGGESGGTLASILGTGAGTLTKADAGTWTLSGANTYTGTTTLNAGTLNIKCLCS